MKNKALLVSHCIFGEYIVKLERLHVINEVIVLITVCLYQSNKTAFASTINEVFNLISILSQYKKHKILNNSVKMENLVGLYWFHTPNIHKQSTPPEIYKYIQMCYIIYNSPYNTVET